jgi:hypothetical protein
MDLFGAGRVLRASVSDSGADKQSGILSWEGRLVPATARKSWPFANQQCERIATLAA